MPVGEDVASIPEGDIDYDAIVNDLDKQPLPQTQTPDEFDPDAVVNELGALDKGEQKAATPDMPTTWRDYYQKNWHGGWAGITRMEYGVEALVGDRTYEDIKFDADYNQLKNLETNTAAMNDRISNLDPRKWLGVAANSFPFTVEVGKSAAVGGVGGAVIGAPAGAPGILTGAGWGARTGSFVTSSKLMAGGLYMDLRDAGASHETAQIMAASGGVIMGVIEAAQLDRLTFAGKQQFTKQLMTPEGKKSIGAFLGEFVKETGIQVSEEEMQEVTDIVATDIAAMIESNPDMVLSSEEIQNRLTQTFVQSLQASGVLVAGAQVSGAAAGKTVSAIKNADMSAIESKQLQIAEAGKQALLSGKITFKKALNAIREGFSTAPGEIEETVAEISEQEIDKTIDELSKPLFDEEGNPIVEETENIPTLKATVEKSQAEVVAEQAQQTEAKTAQTEPPERFKNKAGVVQRFNEKRHEVDANGQVIDKLSKKVIGEPFELSARAKSEIERVQIDLDRIDQNIDTLTQSIVDKEANKNEVNKQLDELFDLRETLEIERAALNQDITDPGQILEQINKREERSVFESRAAALVEQVRGFAFGARKGATITRQQVKRVQQDITSLIRKAPITQAQKAKFLTAVKNAQTPAQFLKMAAKINARVKEMVLVNAKREAGKRILKTLKESRLKKQGKRPVGKLTADAQTVLDIFNEFVTDKSSDVAADSPFGPVYKINKVDTQVAIEEVKQAMKEGKIPTADQVLRAQIAAEVLNMENMTLDELENLATELESYLKAGKADNRLKRQIKEENRRKAVEESLQSIEGKKPTTKKEIAEIGSKTFQKSLRTMWDQLSSWSGLMHIISQHDRSHAIQKLLDDTVANKKYFELMTRVLNFADAKIAQAVADAAKKAKIKKPKDIARHLADGNKVRDWGEYTTSEGGREVLTASRNQLMKLYQEFKAGATDANIRATMEQSNKYTFELSEEILRNGGLSLEKLVNDSLSEIDKAIADAELEIYKWIHGNVLNPFWRDEFGVDIPSSENYSPLKRSGVIKDTTMDMSLLQQFTRSENFAPSSTIARTENTFPLALQDAHEALARHIDEITRFVGYYEFDQLTRGVFDNPGIKEAIIAKYGANLYNTIINHRNDIVMQNRFLKDTVSSWFHGFRRRLATGFIGGKPDQFLKQMTAFVYALDKVSVDQLITSWGDLVSNPKKVWDTLSQSATFRERIRFRDRDLADVFQNQQYQEFTKSGSIADSLMAFVGLGDRASVMVGGWAVYKEALKRTGSHDEALTEFEEWFDSSQQSGNISRLSAVQRNGGLMSIFTLFTTQPMQAMEKIVNEARDVRNFGGVQEWRDFTRTMLVYWVLGPGLFSLVAEAVRPDGDAEDEEFKSEMIAALRGAVMGPLSGLPILGEFITWGGIAATNWAFDRDEYVYKPEFILHETGNNLIAGIQELLKATGEEGIDGVDWLKAAKKLSRSAPLVTGIPFPAFVGYASQFMSDDEESADSEDAVKKLLEMDL